MGRSCGGVTHQEMGDVLRTLARDDAATALCLSMHSHLVAAQVWRRKAGMDADDVFVPDGAVSLVRPAGVWHPIWNTVRRALEIVGGSGFARSSDLERLQRDVTGALFHPLPRARQAIFSGRVALGWDPAG